MTNWKQEMENGTPAIACGRISVFLAPLSGFAFPVSRFRFFIFLACAANVIAVSSTWMRS
jgi:hypothetical protein